MLQQLHPGILLATDIHKKSILHHAAQHNQLDTVKWILAEPGYSDMISQPDRQGHLPYDTAVNYHGTSSVVARFLAVVIAFYFTERLS